MDVIANVNWLATGVGTIVAFLVGWAWYSPLLFGVKWAEGSRVDLGTADQMPVFAMASQLLALLFLATVIGITRVSEDLLTAVLAILAVATFNASGGAFVQKTNYAITVDFFYIIACGAVMIACQGLL
jgi:uncharacterized protein DUF1761|tara:strand:+ start:116724 stop:117107 length:384 start_codon:yes stop_codon:yes gene_type:complete